MHNIKNKQGNEIRNNNMNFRVTNKEKEMILSLKGEHSLSNFIINLIENNHHNDSNDDLDYKEYILDKVEKCYKNEIRNSLNDVKIIIKK